MRTTRKLQVGTILISVMIAFFLFNPVIEPTQVRIVYTDNMGLEFHVWMHHHDSEGNLLARSYHAGVITIQGLNYIENQLGDSPGADPAKWIGLSNSTDSPSSAWTEIPDEITTGNMGRAPGTYASVGDGVWNITQVYSPSESNSTRLTGLYWSLAGADLLASDLIDVINYQSGDTVTITWQITQT